MRVSVSPSSFQHQELLLAIFHFDHVHYVDGWPTMATHATLSLWVSWYLKDTHTFMGPTMVNLVARFLNQHSTSGSQLEDWLIFVPQLAFINTELFQALGGVF